MRRRKREPWGALRRRKREGRCIAKEKEGAVGCEGRCIAKEKEGAVGCVRAVARRQAVSGVVRHPAARGSVAVGVVVHRRW